MQLEVLGRKENPLLKRTEVRFKAIHKAESTPTREALRAFLAKELKATKDIVVIDSQASTFGRYETHGYAKVYKSKEEALAVERKHILVRNKLIEPEVKEKKEAAPKPEKPAPAPKPEKAEKPAPQAKPEAPKEEKKAEAKPEAKAEKAPPKEEKKAAPKEEKKPAEKKDEKKEEKKEEKKAEPKKKGGK